MQAELKPRRPKRQMQRMRGSARPEDRATPALLAENRSTP